MRELNLRPLPPEDGYPDLTRRISVTQQALPSAQNAVCSRFVTQIGSNRTFSPCPDGHTARVLIACEFSGTVRRAFTAAGFDAWSCDLLPAEDGSNHHITGNVLDVLGDGWDLLIVAHPPCTRLCNSGVRWLSVPPPNRALACLWRELDEGAALFSALWNAPVPRVAVENPVMHRHAKERIQGYQPPAQSVQPWQYGDWETKRTCLWLRGLPPLVPTYRTIDQARAGLGQTGEPAARVHRMPPGADRAKERSRFFPGIARQMAAQWGPLLTTTAQEAQA